MFGDMNEEKEVNTVQALQFELMRLASYNEFDGDRVADDLLANRRLWRAAMMYSLEDLIPLRDIDAGIWQVDTLYILPEPGYENDLLKLARQWSADEIGWIGGAEACKLLFDDDEAMRRNPKAILMLWWD